MSFSIGKAISNSGLADFIANFILLIPFPTYCYHGIIFLLTQILTSCVTNNAGLFLL
jgi:di/tricarboxylate transporter